MALLTLIPDPIRAGTTVTYQRSFSDFPADDGWSLALHIAGVSTFSKTAAANGKAFDITLSAAETAALGPGVYRWVERATKGSEVKDAASGTLTVLADVATAAAGDLQSWEEKTLAVVEAALSGQLTDGIATYQIAGRAVGKIPIRDLIEIRNVMRASVAQQKSGRFGREVRIRFPGMGAEK